MSKSDYTSGLRVRLQLFHQVTSRLRLQNFGKFGLRLGYGYGKLYQITIGLQLASQITTRL